MYDMYPDWGPAKNHHHRDTMLGEPVRAVPTPPAGPDLRDNAGERPDDN